MEQEVSGTLDVRLMRILQVLLAENSVSRTADILGQTQPTISAALKRLREIVGDPILVRSGSHLVPTERALELKETVARILADIDANFVTRSDFDPATSTRRFRLIASNSLGALILPRLVHRLHTVAPGAMVDFCNVPGDGDIVGPLERGEADLAIVNPPIEPGQLRMAPLLTTDLVCMVGRHHPIARQRTIALSQYLTLDHISPTPTHMAATGPIDSKLAALGHARTVTCCVPEFGVIPFMLAQSNLVFTTGRPFAEHLAAIMPFAVIDAPPELGDIRFHLLWHERQHRSAAHRWLRQIVREVTGEIEHISAGAPGHPERTA
ncbi:MAG: LysR family transcriptional regulator [Rhizobiales bacterium]|nr:LysR family transcriptional regulator [Hyphomicrobiales bacterium]